MMPQGMEWQGGYMTPAAFIYATWNSADSRVENVLSLGDLKTTRSAAADNFTSTRATKSHSTGKYYFEITINALNGFNYNNGIGIANSTHALTASTGGDLNSIGFFNSTEIDINNTDSGNGAAFATGNTVAFAFDLDNEKAWNANITSGLGWMDLAIGSANPATNTGGISFAALNAGPWFPAINHYISTDAATVNFGATAYAGTPPAGFVNW